jgi:hypothetical protein
VIRAGVLALLLAGPAAAEGLCDAAWAKVSAGLATFGTASGQVGQEGDWCVVQGVILDLDGQYLPDWHVDRLRIRGSALGWLVDGAGAPVGLEIGVEGLRLVVQTGNPQMDWLFAAQARPNAIDAETSLSWDAAARELRLEGLSIDFPGENLVEAQAVLTGVDLSSMGAMQMSVTSFALTEADLRITTHGLFEWYVLMALGPNLLPPEGDMEAAAEGLRASMRAAVAELPGASFSDASKAALGRLIDELPNPSGDLAVSLRSEAGVGPGRLTGWVMTGVPQTVAEAAGVLEGVTVEVGWTHADAP